MPFLAKTEREIQQEVFQMLTENTAITRLTPGGKARAILDIVSKLLRVAYQEFDINLMRAFLSGASGQFLDLFGVMLGEPREPSYAAVAESDLQNVKFYVKSGTFGNINSSNPIIISRGTLISSKASASGIVYRLMSDLTCGASANQAWASVEAISPGSSYNVGSNMLVYHDFISYTDYLNSTLLVTNVYPIGSGKDVESDTNYKYRLSKKVFDAEAANETSLRLAALSVPGVADVIMKKNYKGIGTFGIILKSVTPTASDTLVDNVTSRVSLKQSYGSIAFIKKQKELGFSMKTRVWYKRRQTEDELDEIENMLKDSVKDFINGLDLGETFIADRMMGGLYDIDDNISAFGSYQNPIDESWIYKLSRLEDNRVPEQLLGDYTPNEDERIIIESTSADPVVFERKFGLRTNE